MKVEKYRKISNPVSTWKMSEGDANRQRRTHDTSNTFSLERNTIAIVLVEWASSRKQRTTNVGENVMGYTVGGNANWYSHIGNLFRGVSKAKNRTTVWLSYSTPPKNQLLYCRRYLHTNVCHDALYNGWYGLSLDVHKWGDGWRIMPRFMPWSTIQFENCHL